MKAARALADITVEQLAERITGRGLGAKTLYNIERGERSLQPREIDAIAQACAVPPAFFTVDLDEALADSARRNGRIDSLTSLVADLEDALRSMEARLVVLEAEGPQRSADTGRSTGDSQ